MAGPKVPHLKTFFKHLFALKPFEWNPRICSTGLETGCKPVLFDLDQACLYVKNLLIKILMRFILNISEKNFDLQLVRFLFFHVIIIFLLQLNWCQLQNKCIKYQLHFWSKLIFVVWLSVCFCCRKYLKTNSRFSSNNTVNK